VILTPKNKKNVNTKLWVGAINYRRLPHSTFLRYLHNGEKSTTDNQKNPIDIFLHNIPNYRWKILYYKHPRLNIREDQDWDGRLLLIRESNRIVKKDE